MWQSLEILNVFNTLILKQIFWKIKKTFFKNLEYRFWIQSTKIEKQHFYTKLPRRKPILKEIEWGIQNAPITKNFIILV